MAKVQYVNPSLQINKVAGLGLVKYPEQLGSWYKAARKAIALIPKLDDESTVRTRNQGWYLYAAQPSEAFVRYEIMDIKDNRAYVIIDRTATAFGS